MSRRQPQVLDIYTRVSRLGDDRQRSTEGQADDCTARVAERGARIGEVHVDSGRSAWNPRVRRPGWDRLMTRLESGATGGVVVFDLARFSRRPVEGERLIAAAENGLLVLDSEGEYDLMSASGKKAFRDQLAAAAYESDRLSTRVRRGKRLKAMRGEPNGTGRPFGFEADGVTIRESEAAVLRELTARVLAGESLNVLVADLASRGVPTAPGGPWTATSLRQVLTRPRNAGLVAYRGAVVARLPGEAILPEDVYDQVGAVFAARRRGRPVSDAYLCSGVAHCGLCGHTLGGRPRSGGEAYPDGAPRRQYVCQRRGNAGGCGRVVVDQRELDRHARALVVAILGDPRNAARVEAKLKAATAKRRKLDDEIAQCEHLAGELATRLGRGEMSLARHDKAAAPLDKRLAELRARRAELDTVPAEPVPASAVAASRAEIAADWDAATTATAERRALLRRALNGRRLVVMPADPHAPRRFDPNRIVIEDGRMR